MHSISRALSNPSLSGAFKSKSSCILWEAFSSKMLIFGFLVKEVVASLANCFSKGRVSSFTEKSNTWRGLMLFSMESTV